MDIKEIENIWSRSNNQLDSSIDLNLTLLRRELKDKAKRSLNSMLFLPVSSLIFYLATSLYGIYFSYIYWDIWHLTLSGVVVTIFSSIFVVFSVVQLKYILSIDYDSPVIKLQKDISKIRSAIIWNLNVIPFIIPFWLFIGTFCSKSLFGLDLLSTIDLGYLIKSTAVIIVVEFVMFLIIRGAKWRSKFINWLLIGNGSQVDEALGFIKQIDKFDIE